MSSPGKLLPIIPDCDLITNLCLVDLEEYYGDVMDSFRADADNAFGMLKVCLYFCHFIYSTIICTMKYH